MNRRAALYNLGCKVNAYETDAMTQLLIGAGYEIVDFEQEAEVYIINTCTVTNTADKKSRQILHRARKSHPDSVVLATGCYVETWEDPDDTVDILVGNNCKKDIVEILDAWFKEHGDGSRYPEPKYIDTACLNEHGEGSRYPESKYLDTVCLKEHGEGSLRYFADINHVKKYEDLTITETSGHTRAFIKVQDGCNQFCSYCMIPYARGRVRSRAMAEVINEVEALVANGYREVVITGIHLSSYGTDFDDPCVHAEELHDSAVVLENVEKTAVDSENVKDSVVNLERIIDSAVNLEKFKDSADNLEKIGVTRDYRAGSKQRFYLTRLIKRIHEVEGLDRIRLGSLEPRIITEEFIDEMKQLPKLCHHFHLSLQSGCDITLRAMNRRYTAEEYRNSCNLIRKAWPDAALTTDVITGFPGESEEDFEESYRFVESIGFYETHIFPYSRRRGTRADAMTGHLSESIKKSRSARLIELNRENKKKFMESFAGNKVEILPEEEVELSGMNGKYILGHTMEYVHCAIPADMVGDWKNMPYISVIPEEYYVDAHSREELMLCRR